VQAGVSATAGSLYDKDTRVKAWADGQFKLSDKVEKDSVIAEVTQEYVALKKSLGET